MPWFRLDDGFYDNPKVARAGNCAIGLWIRCATWSARHLTDGHIPTEIVRALGKPREAHTLEQAGLWILVDDEYLIPDWLEYNRSAREIKETRRADAERKRSAMNPTGIPTDSERPSRPSRPSRKDA